MVDATTTYARNRQWMEWVPGFAVASIVPIANFRVEGVGPHVVGATNDVTIVLVILCLMPMSVLWGIMEHRTDLWERMSTVVLLGFGAEMLAWVLQRGHYGAWRVGNVLAKCNTPDADVGPCKKVALLLTDWVGVPGALQWSAAVAMICIASPVLSHYMPKLWFIASVSFATVVWVSMLYLFAGI